MTLIAIPARKNSSRLKNKLLLSETGKPLIVHTIENIWAHGQKDIVVLTEDQEIYDSTCSLVETILTPKFDCGTDRIMWFCSFSGIKNVINVQADEPELDISKVVNYNDKYKLEGILTFCTTLKEQERNNQNVVKVVVNNAREAMYFSRQPIPGDKHIGCYCYGETFIKDYYQFIPSNYSSENLEQLKFLENRVKIRVESIYHPYDAIDTQEQYNAFVTRRFHK